MAYVKESIFENKNIGENKLIPYILLVVISVLFCFVAVAKQDNGSFKMNIGRNGFIKKNNLALPMFFFVLLFLLMVRNISVGRDLEAYKYIFNTVREQTLSEVLTFDFEFLYRVLIWTVGLFTDSFQVFIAIVAVITVVPIAMVFCEDRTHGLMKISIFVNMSTFVMLFSGLRQSIAMAIGMLVYKAVREKKIVKYLLYSILAIGFHTSAFMLFFMYPLYHLTLKKKHLLIIVPVMLALFIFNDQVFGVLLTIYAFIGGNQESITQTGAMGSLLLFAVFALFSYIIPDESDLDREAIGLRNFLLMAVALQCFAPLHSLAMRMNYYYIIFIPLAMGKVVSVPSLRFRQLSRLGEIVITAFFVLSFVVATYSSYVTGESSLDTVPYIPFWKG